MNQVGKNRRLIQIGYLAFCAILAAGLVAGCQKQESGAGAGTGQLGAPEAPPSPRGPGPMAETATNPVVIRDTGDANATLQQLTMELRDYVVRTRSVPRTFEEFASKSQVRYPPAPAGKKYAIEGQAVVLVKE